MIIKTSVLNISIKYKIGVNLLIAVGLIFACYKKTIDKRRYLSNDFVNLVTIIKKYKILSNSNNCKAKIILNYLKISYTGDMGV